MPMITSTISSTEKPMRRVSAQAVRLLLPRSVIMKNSAWPRLNSAASSTTINRAL